MEKSSGFRSGHDTGHLSFFMNAGKWALHQSWVEVLRRELKKSHDENNSINHIIKTLYEYQENDKQTLQSKEQVILRLQQQLLELGFEEDIYS
uniref:Uncharacterized protein n=1 Tax=Caenorhabditis japonica TaxID=281687 RepID=A0A8R1DNL6_CAEJA